MSPFPALIPLLLFVGSQADISPVQMMPNSDFIDLMARDQEPLPEPIAFGHKFMTGGAGEGEQQLQQDKEFKQREQVKSDNVLPAYCEPPNPCPVGYTAADGCLEEFENSAEFSREYQAQQQCICDQEHMFNCANKQADDMESSLQDLLDDNLHKTMMAKKFHEKRSFEMEVQVPLSFFTLLQEPRRRKRSVGHAKQPNPYLQGEPLRSMQKKDGKHTW